MTDHQIIARHVSRRGIAPLELVMSLPFLVGLAAMIYSLANSSIGRSGAAVNARHAVWQLRSDPESDSESVLDEDYTKTKPLSCFEIVPGNSESGMLSGNVELDRAVYVGFGSSKTAQSGATLLTRTWDYRDVTGFQKSGPHFQVLLDMGGIGLGLLGKFSGLTGMSLSSLPNSDQIAAAESTADDAMGDAAGKKEKVDEELQRERERLQHEIDRLEREKQALIAKLQPLQSEYDAKQAQLDRDLNEMARLQRLGQPVPPSLSDRIAANRNRLQQLEREINAIQGQIDAKQAEINELQGTLGEMDSVGDEGDEQLNNPG